MTLIKNSGSDIEKSGCPRFRFMKLAVIFLVQAR